MNTAPMYPEGSQIADAGLSSQMGSLTKVVERGFDRQERYNDKQDARFDGMVTRAEFKAEVGRMDARHDATNREVNEIRGSFSKEVSELKEEVSDGFKEQALQATARTHSQRWFTGIIFTAAGVAVAIVNTIF